MKKIKNWINDKLMPLLAKFSDLPYVKTTNKAFMYLIPIIMIGAFSSLLMTINIPFISSSGINDVLSKLNMITLGYYSVFLAFVLAYYFSINLGMKKEAILVAIIALSTFLVTIPSGVYDGVSAIQDTYLGSKGLLMVMIVVYVVVRFYKLCMDKGIYIRMPEGVPSFIQDSFAGIIPSLLIMTVFYFINKLCVGAGYSCMTETIFAFLSKPLYALTGNWFLMAILLSMNYLSWFFGIHAGCTAMPIQLTLLMAPALENMETFAANRTLNNMITIGSSGFIPRPEFVICVCALLCKTNKRVNSIGKASVLPAFFGITEPILFGLPIIYNLYLIIPLVIYPIITYLVLFGLQFAGIISYPRSGFLIGVPFGFSSYIQGGISGLIFQLIAFVLSVIGTMPFMKAWINNTKDKEQDSED